MRAPLIAMLLSALLPLPALAATSGVPATPEAALRQYHQAEHDFDLERLRQVLDPAFIEISPLGQVDGHDAVLSFYTPEKKVDAPPTTMDEVIVHPHGDSAVLATQLRYTVGGRTMAMRLGATARRTPQGWVLISAQYTPIKSNTPPSH
ncbi:nuclear transport factor 2 family protein [Pseudoxanthomonas composti]|uniref:Nuclear transport factor 2 family protein n=1 Tax=Pseudoxanthomonas composti TaxID=2137479 RepID=A0A4Q1K0V7_9GAMM|nr:nuclear transport factor 2 family protein [Pseudoxanthomonas composti]RXR08681.1 nuclear transport factor 2 family protein [Pseudoxanthomonas composti]